jgi:hypothetical protein
MHKCILATVQQIRDRYWYCIVLSLFWAWYRYQYFFCWWENPLSCIWIYKWKKKKLSSFFSFFLQYGQISCVSNKFLVGSVIWDDTEYFLTFQRQYVFVVSGKWDNTNTVWELLWEWWQSCEGEIADEIYHVCNDLLQLLRLVWKTCPSVVLHKS